MTHVKLFVFFLLGWSSVLGADNVSRELIGEWTYTVGGTLTIQGHGHERRVVFSDHEKGINVTFKRVKIRFREEVERQSFGPYMVTQLQNNHLYYMKNDVERHVTWRINRPGSLEWGALVYDDPKEWVFAREVSSDKKDTIESNIYSSPFAGGAFGRIIFSDNPFEVPSGTANIPGLRTNNIEYIYKSISSKPSNSGIVEAINIIYIDEKDEKNELFSITWNESGGPYLEGGIFRTQRDPSRIPNVIYRKIHE